MESRMRSRANGVHFISNEEIPYNLRRRVANWAQDGRSLHGPIEVEAVRETEDHYHLDLILYDCVEDEMGAHNFTFKDIRFKKYHSRRKE